MNIEDYTFEEFRQLAANFHGYAAPGLLIGGYMVSKAKSHLPQGTLFEAVVETAKCLPDAVQLLSVCSTGNQRLKIHNLGRYAVSLFDKYTGEGARVSLDLNKMKKWPELYDWFMKKKPKKEQNTEKLEEEIRQAGDSICKVEKIKIKKRFLGAKHMTKIAACPICGEAYPVEDGSICRGCQGEAPYSLTRTNNKDNLQENLKTNAHGLHKVVPVEEAIGKIAAHDMTRIEPGQFKGPEFKAGQRIEVGDICRLQRMGRFNVAVEDDENSAVQIKDDSRKLIHENEAALAFAKRMAGSGIIFDENPHEGKIDFRAGIDGLLCVNREELRKFNLVPQVMAASRQDNTLVKKDSRVAGTRAIPLYLPGQYFEAALSALTAGPLFQVLPLRRPKTGILVTGTEVFQGLIEDKFIPIISAKIAAFDGEIVKTVIVPDDGKAIKDAIDQMLDAGIDLLITTGGLSVDPDDVTRQALLEAGLENAVHGVPVLPGTMSLVGNLHGKNVQVIGVPACALYYKTTFLDLVLPRLLAGCDFDRAYAAQMGEGGYCLSCKVCAWPKCSFGK